MLLDKKSLNTNSGDINLFNLLILMNLTFRMLLNIYIFKIQKYHYNFENCTYIIIVKRDWAEVKYKTFNL